MEDYENKVANLHANQSQNISKLPANYTRSEPLELRGAMGGGPTPPMPGALLAAVSRSPKRVSWLRLIPSGCWPKGPMGTPWVECLPYLFPYGMSPPRMAPLISGSITSHLVTDFYRLFGLSRENTDHYFRTTVVLCDRCFFFR